MAPPSAGGVAAATTLGVSLAKAAASAATVGRARVGEGLQRRHFSIVGVEARQRRPFSGERRAGVQPLVQRNGEDRLGRAVAFGCALCRGDARFALGRGERAFQLGEAILRRAEIGLARLQPRQFALHGADARLESAGVERRGRAAGRRPGRRLVRRRRQRLGRVGAGGARFGQRRFSLFAFARRGVGEAGRARLQRAQATLEIGGGSALAFDAAFERGKTPARRVERARARLDQRRRGERQRRAEESAERAGDEGKTRPARPRPDSWRWRGGGRDGGRFRARGLLAAQRLACGRLGRGFVDRRLGDRRRRRRPIVNFGRLALDHAGIVARLAARRGDGARRGLERFRVRISGSVRRPWVRAPGSRLSISAPPRDGNPRGAPRRAPRRRRHLRARSSASISRSSRGSEAKTRRAAPCARSGSPTSAARQT